MSAVHRLNTARRSITSVALLAVMAACTDAVSPSDPGASITAASVTDAGMVRTISVSLDRASEVAVDYWTEGANRLRITSQEDNSTHELFLPRLRASSEYSFEVRAIDSAGSPGPTSQGTFETDSLPTNVAQLQFQVIGQATFPLLMLSRASDGGWVIIDTNGYVVWYHDGVGPGGFTRLENGDFVFRTMVGLEVVTPWGEVVASLTRVEAAERMGLSTVDMHHDVIVTPENTVLTLARAGDVTVNDTTWAGEEIWVWDPVTDALDRRWSAKDFLSPDVQRGSRSRPDDWLHANSLSFGPRGNILVSFFWLHAVVSIAADYQSIEWQLGGPASTFTVGDDAMEAGQHTATEVSPNRVLLFDNGLDREEGLYSRAIELEIGQGTAEVVWEFRPNPDIYAPIVSSVRRLENGNSVVGFATNAGVSDPPSTGPIAAFEVTPENRILWQLVVEGTRVIYRLTPLYQIGGEVVVN